MKGRYAIAELTSVPCQVLSIPIPSSPQYWASAKTQWLAWKICQTRTGKDEICYVLWVTRFREFPKLTQKPLAKLALSSMFLAFLLPLLTNCCSSQRSWELVRCTMWATILALWFCWLQNILLYAVAFLWSTIFGFLCMKIRARWRLLLTHKPSWHRHEMWQR